MKSDRTLRKWFRLLNARFFYGACNDSVLVRWSESDAEDDDELEDIAYGWTDVAHGHWRFQIVLSRRLCRDKMTILNTLAHEMIHVATETRDDHGPEFESWRQRIADRGLFRKGAVLKGVTLF